MAEHLGVMETNISVEPNAQAKCLECGRTFSLEDMISHGANHVCANCKPIFIQKLAEGAYIPLGKKRYAGFWRRFAAVFVDSLLLWLVNYGVEVITLSIGQSLDAGPLSLAFLVYGIAITTGACYEGILVAKYGATLGKMLCHIEVVTPNGGPVSLSRSLGRYFAKWLSSITLLIGYIIAAFDSENRTLHDHICNTRVVIT